MARLDVRRPDGRVRLSRARRTRALLSDARGGGRGVARMVTLTEAHAAIERGIAKAQQLGFKVAVAVVDAAGHLVACDRMDGALWVTPEIARAKANAAAAFQASTDDLERRFATARALFAGNVASLGDYQFVFGRGAV